MNRSLHKLISTIGRFGKVTPWMLCAWLIIVMFVNFFTLKMCAFFDIGFAFIFKYVFHLTAFYWQHFLSLSLNFVATLYFIDTTIKEYKLYYQEKHKPRENNVGIHDLLIDELKLIQLRRQFLSSLIISGFSVLALTFVFMQEPVVIALSMFIIIWTQSFVIETVNACRRYFDAIHLRMDALTVEAMNQKLQRHGFITFEFNRGQEDDHIQKDFLVRCSNREYAEIHAFLTLYLHSNQETIKFLINFMQNKYFVTDE